MLIIGIAGGIACGKSSVAKAFQEFGAVILDADQLGHEALSEPEVVEAIRLEWGERVLQDETVNRKALATIVFSNGNDEELKKLEAITHPVIGARIRDKISALKSKEEVPASVLDAPVMFKAGWDNICDKIVFVDVPLSIRLHRARETRGWSEAELVAREQRQLPLDVKRSKATDVIDNSGNHAQLLTQVKQLWMAWGLDLAD